ncbi:MAG: NADH:ubiquinone reductase (Na(+)-transporting) subunit C [Bacteroidales bacterium]|nr:NADH:ubiquinone reductase (Na(+)-transporting) subunit C [Bacteroidales bacterium]
MNVQKNSYTIIYASIMVVAVAAILTAVSFGLKDRQQNNIDNEKRQNILKTVNVEANDENAAQLFEQTVKEAFVVNEKGEIIESNKDNAFKTSISISDENCQLPVFKCEKDGKAYFVVPLKGNGLWGDIWGYASLESDLNTIAGVVFDHASETPGLGDKITTKEFQQLFVGKKLYDEGSQDLKGVTIYKGGLAKNDPLHGIDALSGATLTSNGVQNMINDCFKVYQAYFKNISTSAPVVEQPKEVECSDSLATAIPACDSTNVNTINE